MDSLRLLMRGSGLQQRAKRTPEGLKLPSDGVERCTTRELSPQGRKRKRSELQDVDGEAQTKFTVEQIRQLQKTHKVKVTNLRSLQSNGTESKKAHKEASKMYPQPLPRFSALRNYNINHALLSNLAEQGYKDPTEVQLATIPMLISQEEPEPDLLTVAPTGSGKTLAFLIPLIDKISKRHKDGNDDTHSRQASAIILAPTKELVTQIVNEGRKLGARTGVRITAFKKGMRLHEDITSVTQDPSSASEADEATKSSVVKADIIVSTPLSLVHAITLPTSEMPLPLLHIQNLILDEADVLLDPLFREQTLAIWSACTNIQLRTSLWSATIGSNVEELAMSTVDSRCAALQIKRTQQPPLLRCIIGLKDTSLPNITHKLIYASTEAGKLTGLRNVIRPPPANTTKPTSTSSIRSAPLRPPFLIFTQTIPRATALHTELQYDIPSSTNPDAPSRIAVLHSALSSTQRSTIMQNFRLGRTWILITTDLLSRGIDFRGVNAVINYDIPTTSASYLHRAGRTGRAGREGGTCVTFYTKDDISYLRPIANIIEKSKKLHGRPGGDDEDGGVPKWLLDALPTLSKETKKDLKMRGVDVRRAVKASDDKTERRRKGRNIIGTRSGYEKRLADRQKGMVEGSRRRKQKAERETDDRGGDGEDEFGGFD